MFYILSDEQTYLAEVFLFEFSPRLVFTTPLVFIRLGSSSAFCGLSLLTPVALT